MKILDKFFTSTVLFTNLNSISHASVHGNAVQIFLFYRLHALAFALHHLVQVAFFTSSIKFSLQIQVLSNYFVSLCCIYYLEICFCFRLSNSVCWYWSVTLICLYFRSINSSASCWSMRHTAVQMQWRHMHWFKTEMRSKLWLQRWIRRTRTRMRWIFDLNISMVYIHIYEHIYGLHTYLWTYLWFTYISMNISMVYIHIYEHI